MELTAIPGVGEKTARALAAIDDVERAITEGDVATLASAPEITPGTAARIARAAIRLTHDDHEDLLATPRAEAIYRDLLDILTSYAVTEYGKRHLETLYPSAATSRIEEVRELSERALERTPDTSIRDALVDVTPFRRPTDIRVRERCLATADAERYTEARASVPELSVEVIGDVRELEDLARGYATVVVLDERFAGMDIDGDVRVEPNALDAPETIVPERTLNAFATNRESILAAIDVHRTASIEPPTDLDHLEGVLERLTDDGRPTGDAELDRLAAAVSDIDAAVHTSLNVANDHLRDAIRDRDVTIEGADLLSMVEQGAGVDALLAHELRSEFDDAVVAAREHLIDALRLDADEQPLAEAVIPDHPTYPVVADETAVERLTDDLQRARDRRAMAAKQELASTLAAERDAAETLVMQALDADVELAIATFAETYDCTMPAFEGTGITIQGGRSPLLPLPPDEIEPIEYAVDDVVVLSGVNSGGKTAVLDLVAATAILAHMGLPVPADDVRSQRFAGIHYYAATQGTLDAGAFESTLRQFAELTTAAANTLVLVDELESITEPGAAANIVAGIIEELQGRATGIIVSHLAAEIIDVAGSSIRVDGIEASGVVDGTLVVERSPVCDHLARSTPELIVERLAMEAEGQTGRFYDRLLEKFT